jgi:hypothetical protein
MGKVDADIAFFGGSKRTVNTEDYAMRTKLRKTKSGFTFLVAWR